MRAIAIQKTAIRQAKTPTQVSRKAPMTWEQFERRYLSREDGFKYEWVNGTIIKSPVTMRQKQLFILNNLLDFFYSLKMRDNGLGVLSCETDTFLTPNHHRRPDISYLSKPQIEAAADDKEQVPNFVIEIISPNDKAESVAEKTFAYFQHGVKVVWNIYPAQREVHWCESATFVRICRGDDRCSAEPVIPGFVLAVSEIFKRGGA